MEVRNFTRVVIALVLATGCNLSDPITGPPQVQEGCQSNSDCGDYGTCDDGECSCQPGYLGEVCDTCDAGYYSEGGACLPDSSCAGTVVGGVCVVDTTCEEGEMLSTSGETCVPDLCAEDPCTAEAQIAGTCTMISDTEFACECVEGWTGNDCSVPPSECDAMPCGAFGTCTDDPTGGFTCECDERFAGQLCDSCQAPFANVDLECRGCEAGLYGLQCTLTCDATAANNWWDPSFSERIPVIVKAPGAEAVTEGATVSFRFDHAAFVTAGSRPGGHDMRVVFVDPVDGAQVEVPRILAVDSSWNSSDTELWWAAQRGVPVGAAQVYYLYADNPAANPVANNGAAVLPPLRGWARTSAGEVLYAPMRLPVFPSFIPRTIVHVRQIDPDSFEILVTDESDDGGASVNIEVKEAANQMSFGPIPDLGGTVGAPAVQLLTFDSSSPSLEITVSITESNESRFIFGGVEEARGAGQHMITRIFNRSDPIGPDPETAEICAVQALF